MKGSIDFLIFYVNYATQTNPFGHVTHTYTPKNITLLLSSQVKNSFQGTKGLNNTIHG